MLRLMIAVLAVLMLAMPAYGQDQPEPVRVMVLGTWHFDNPGRDLHNARAEPVTTPQRQAELEAVARALARFAPTAVAVERVARDPSTLRDHRWPEFEPGMLLTHADERVQVGYRLAHLAGIDRVYAIDEQPAADEDIDYFPYGEVVAWARANGRMGDLEAGQAPIAAHVADFEARQRTATLGALLAEANHPDHPIYGAAGQGLMYGMLAFGSGRDLPGADLNAAWYRRNARIFAKLVQVARPGDRIVVVFAAGHAYWLRHFVETTPGFELVDPGDYLAGL